MKQRKYSRLLIQIFLFFLSSTVLFCGDLIVEGDYPGLPMLHIRGEVHVRESIPSSSQPIKIAVLWNFDYSEELQILGAKEQEAKVSPVFPATYHLKLYTEPPSAAMVTMPGTEEEVTFGLIMIYRDLNGNGVLDLEGEIKEVVGGAPNYLILYTSGDLPAGTFPGVDELLVSGYHIISISEKICDEGMEVSDLEMLVMDNVDIETPVTIFITPQIEEFFPDIDCDGDWHEPQSECENPNDCGGCKILENPPGTPCGGCGESLTFLCDGSNKTSCIDDYGTEDNPMEMDPIGAFDQTLFGQVESFLTSTDDEDWYRIEVVEEEDKDMEVGLYFVQQPADYRVCLFYIYSVERNGSQLTCERGTRKNIKDGFGCCTSKNDREEDSEVLISGLFQADRNDLGTILIRVDPNRSQTCDRPYRIEGIFRDPEGQ